MTNEENTRSLNQHDAQYHRCLLDIMGNGVMKEDRTGTGTKSIFEHTIRFDMKNGFPLITTKKMFQRGIITELLWFLSGNTNIQALVKQGNNIWVGDAYKNYLKEERPIADMFNKAGNEECKDDDFYRHFTEKEFTERIKTNDEFANEYGDLGPIYSKQWVNWEGWKQGVDVGMGLISDGGINQIQGVINALNNNPDSRRIMVSAWNVAEIEEAVLPPCHFFIQFYTEELTAIERNDLINKRNNSNHTIEDCFSVEEFERETQIDADAYGIPKRKISLKWSQRSCDTFLGIPFNIASYAFLLEMIAQQVNMVPDKLVGDLTNVHIYSNHLDQVKEQLARGSKANSPTLKLNKAKDIFSYKLEDFEMLDYEAHPTIKGDLSN